MSNSLEILTVKPGADMSKSKQLSEKTFVCDPIHYGFMKYLSDKLKT